MKTPSISVVIPAFRAAETLRRTVESCLGEISPHNVIVVLDGPDAGLEQVARGVAEGVRVVVLPQPAGAPVCRNLGLQLVDTDYVMFLDADDYVEGRFLASACRSARTAEADVVLGRFSFELPDGSRETIHPNERYTPLDNATVLKKWLMGGYTPPCSVVWRSAFVRSLGGWDETLVKNQDGDIMYRALMRGAVLTSSMIGQGIYSQGDDPGRITRRHSRRTLESQFAVLEKIRVQLDVLPFDPRAELANAYYNLARLAFSIGSDDLGQRSESTARALGLAGQPGSLIHSLVASTLGLSGKQRLASFVRQIVSR